MRTTIRLSDELSSHVDDVRHDDDTSHAEAVRQCIRRSRRLAEAEAEIDELETEVERLRREKRLILEERAEKQELATYAEQQRTRQQRKDEAGIVTRAKWLLIGMDTDDDATA